MVDSYLIFYGAAITSDEIYKYKDQILSAYEKKKEEDPTYNVLDIIADKDERLKIMALFHDMTKQDHNRFLSFHVITMSGKGYICYPFCDYYTYVCGKEEAIKYLKELHELKVPNIFNNSFFSSLQRSIALYGDFKLAVDDYILMDELESACYITQ